MPHVQMRMAEQAEEQRRAAEQAAVSARAAEQARKAALAEERRLKLEAEVQVRSGDISRCCVAACGAAVIQHTMGGRCHDGKCCTVSVTCSVAFAQVESGEHCPCSALCMT